jgi:hypothetical protein
LKTHLLLQFNGSSNSWIGTVGASDSTIELISALEDQLPGFSANWTSNLSSGDYPMSREQDDKTYSGVIGPKISTRLLQLVLLKYLQL